MTKPLIFVIFSLISILIAISFVSAAGVQLLCLEEGQTVRFSQCNPRIADRTCSSSGGCQYCVNQLSSGFYCPENINSCNSGSFSCTALQNQTTNQQVTVTAVSPADRYTTNLTNTISFAFNVANSNSVRSCSLFINYTIVRSNSTAVVPSLNTITYTFQPGNYTWSIRCIDRSNRASSTQPRRLTMLPFQETNSTPTNSTNSTTPQDTQQNFSVILIAPENSASFTTPASVSFDYQIKNLTSLSKCDLILNNATAASNTTAISLNSTNSILKELEANTYTWSISCTNRFNRTFNSTIRSLTVNSPPPVNTGGNNGGGGGGGGSYIPPKTNNATNSTTVNQTLPTNFTELSQTTNQTLNSSLPEDNNATEIPEQSSQSFVTGAAIGIGKAIKNNAILFVILFAIFLAIMSFVVQAKREKKKYFR